VHTLGLPVDPHPDGRPNVNDPHLTVRLAASEDEPALRWLADVDSARRLTGHVLIAELEDQPRAAISLATGTVVANPFKPSADIVHVLRLRRYQLMRQGSDMAPVRSLLRRLVATPTG
jgi:hypothetical protein